MSRTEAQAFNEWMRRYIDEPDRFKREWQQVEEFKREHADGVVPSYGDRCAEYLQRLMRGE